MIDPEEKKTSSFIHRPNITEPTPAIRHFFTGRPLQTADAEHETISKRVGLAVFASDALSSTAYATQEILVILAGAGTMAFTYVFPISIVIVILLAIVVVSYEQIIHAYPDGGGAYIVAYDNLGHSPALVAAAALLVDYILTVSVSVSSGVAQITSAYPALYELRVPMAVFFVGLITLINLRGVRESGMAFAIPSYFFIVIMFLLIGSGLFQLFNGSLGMVIDPPEIEHLGETILTNSALAFLLLHAFSSGTAALTGVEAISNGITAFKEPRSRNAGITLIWMALILGSLFIGISFLTREIHAVPSEVETVISQLARTIFAGQSWLYLFVIGGTTVILILAANTAFAGFPRLSAMLAHDGFMPRQLTYRGSRLVYSYGIVSLGAIASVLIVVFQASVTRLIPLYAIGVFLSFTLAQTGMAKRWRRVGKLDPQKTTSAHDHDHGLHYEKSWLPKMISNGFGAVCTFIVMCVFAVTKFKDGAWVVLILTPMLIGLFAFIRRHYNSVASGLSLDQYGEPPPYIGRHRVIVPISNVHQGTLAALRYARVLSDDVTAVHISIEPEDTEKVQKKWEKWGRGTRLVIVDSPYRLFLEPLLLYIEEILSSRQPNETITIVVPHFVATQKIHNTLHMQTAEMLRRELLTTSGVVITEIPYQIP